LKEKYDLNQDLMVKNEQLEDMTRKVTLDLANRRADDNSQRFEERRAIDDLSD